MTTIDTELEKSIESCCFLRDGWGRLHDEKRSKVTEKLPYYFMRHRENFEEYTWRRFGYANAKLGMLFMQRDLLHAPNPPIDTEHRDAPICPYCGIASNSHLVEGTNGITYDAKCPSCQQPFTVTRHVTITYTTKEGER